MVDVAVLILVIAAVWVLYIGAIVAAARRPDYAYRHIGRTKPGTVILIVLTGFIGGSYFLLRIRRQLLAAEQAIPPGSLPPPDTGDVKQWRQTLDP